LRYFKPAPIRADGRHSPKPMSANKTVRPCSCPASDQAGKRTVSMALHVGDGSFATVWPVAGHFRSSPNIGRNQIISLPATTLKVDHSLKSSDAAGQPSGTACTHSRGTQAGGKSRTVGTPNFSGQSPLWIERYGLRPLSSLSTSNSP
jgi:hypothetical protein